MSVGMFLGVRPSFTAECQDHALLFLTAINDALRRAGIDEYAEPEVIPDPYIDHCFGRSELDHHSAGTIAGVASLDAGGHENKHLGLLATNPCRAVFLPRQFQKPIETGYVEDIDGEPTSIWAGSLPILARELECLAQTLGIRLQDGDPSDHTARMINDLEPFSDDDTVDCDDRMAWLMLYEGCRIARSADVALSFAG